MKRLFDELFYDVNGKPDWISIGVGVALVLGVFMLIYASINMFL